MYLLRNLCGHKGMGGHGFSIELPEFWPTWVERSGLTQAKVDYKIANSGNEWLDACGFDGMYEARSSIRVSWGKWGVEHVSVPGNACGLDIDSCPMWRFLERGAMLTPHNIDSTAQKMLLLIVFSSFAEDVALFSRKL